MSSRTSLHQAQARQCRPGGDGPARSARKVTVMGRAEGFLARWSRRKRLAAARPHAATDPVIPAKAPDAPPVSAEGAEGTAIAASQSLPPITSLDAGSDIMPFLAPGVPVGLTCQALRRAWMADPAIREFVELSENAWDFTVSDGVPGFGPLSAEDARRLVARKLGPAEGADTPAPEKDTTTPPADTAAPSEEAETGRIAEGRDFGRYHLHRSGQIATDTGTQQGIGGVENNRPLSPHSHGGALPK